MDGLFGVPTSVCHLCLVCLQSAAGSYKVLERHIDATLKHLCCCKGILNDVWLLQYSHTDMVMVFEKIDSIWPI